MPLSELQLLYFEATHKPGIIDGVLRDGVGAWRGLDQRDIEILRASIDPEVLSLMLHAHRVAPTTATGAHYSIGDGGALEARYPFGNPTSATTATTKEDQAMPSGKPPRERAAPRRRPADDLGNLEEPVAEDLRAGTDFQPAAVRCAPAVDPTDFQPAAVRCAPAVDPTDFQPAAVRCAPAVDPNVGWDSLINLQGAVLRGADLAGHDLRGADLRGADLRNADLTGADLRGAKLTGANLEGANIRDVKWK